MDLEDSGDEQPVPLQILLVVENVAVSQVCHQCFLCVLNTPHVETQFIGNIIIIICITSSGEEVAKRLLDISQVTQQSMYSYDRNIKSMTEQIESI